VTVKVTIFLEENKSLSYITDFENSQVMMESFVDFMTNEIWTIIAAGSFHLVPVKRIIYVAVDEL
jgi:hypothetical protein